MTKHANREWLLLIHQLQPKPTSLRVPSWRKLRFNRLEAVGFAAVVDGLVEGNPDDRERLDRCGAVFDGLYALYGKRSASKLPTARGEQAGDGAGGQPAGTRRAK